MSGTSLAGKTALITGSTSGIGLGIAQALAAQGANIVVNGFGDHAGAVAAIEAAGAPAAMYHAADMRLSAQIADMMNAAAARFGGVDILVNNAGIQHVAAVENFPPEQWDAIIAINLTSAFHTTRLAIPGMRSRNWGRVINIASAHGLVASAHKSAYVASKHGIVGLTKTVALETANTNITCNAICPGWVLTPLVQKQVDARAAQNNLTPQQAKADLLSEKQPHHDFTTPEQLGALAVFMCSEAAANVRGAIWNMDGGWVAQ